MKRNILIIGLTALGLLATACGGKRETAVPVESVETEREPEEIREEEPAPVPVPEETEEESEEKGARKTEIRVEVDQSTVRLAPGESVQLKSYVIGSDQKTTWSSSNTDVAGVSPDGLVTAVSEGQALVEAQNAGRAALCVVYVTKDGRQETRETGTPPAQTGTKTPEKKDPARTGTKTSQPEAGTKEPEGAADDQEEPYDDQPDDTEDDSQGDADDQEEAPVTSYEDILDQYQDVLDRDFYREEIEEEADPVWGSFVSRPLLETAVWNLYQGEEGAAYYIFYAEQDINGDGIDELLIGGGDRVKNVTVYGFFTMEENGPVPVFDADYLGGDAGISFLPDGSFVVYTGPAITVWQLPEGSSQPRLTGSYIYSVEEDACYYEEPDGTRREITLDEYYSFTDADMDVLEISWSLVGDQVMAPMPEVSGMADPETAVQYLQAYLDTLPGGIFYMDYENYDNAVTAVSLCHSQGDGAPYVGQAWIDLETGETGFDWEEGWDLDYDSLPDSADLW